MAHIGSVSGATFPPGLSRNTETWQIATLGVGADTPDKYAIRPLNSVMPNLGQPFHTAHHSATTFQTLIGLSLALVIFGALGLIAHKGARALEPLAVAGRIPAPDDSR